MRSRLSTPVPRSYSQASCDFSSEFLTLLQKDLSNQRKEEAINKSYAYDLQLANYSDFGSLTALPSLFKILPFDAYGGGEGDGKETGGKRRGGGDGGGGDGELEKGRTGGEEEKVSNTFGGGLPSGKGEGSGKKIVLFFGYAVPLEGGLLEKSYLDFIRKMNEVVEGGYYMVFFNTGISSFEQRHFTFLRNCYQRLPMKYLLGLEQIFILSPTLLLKSFLLLSSGFASKVIEHKTIYIDNLKQLRQYPIFPLDLKKYLPDFISKEDDSISKRAGAIGKSLSDWNLEENGLPESLVFLISYFEVNPDHFQTQGIFRLAAEAKEMGKLEKELNEGNFEQVFEIKDVHIICNMIKKFFSAMPEPLFGFANYSAMWEIANLPSKEEKLEKLKELISLFSRLNLKTFQFFLAFLKKIESFKDQNLMTSNNLAIVFMPCFLRPMQYSGEDLKKTPKLVDIFRILLDNPGLIPPPLLRRTSAPLSRELLGNFEKNIKKEESQGSCSTSLDEWGGVLKVVRKGFGAGVGIGRAESLSESGFNSIMLNKKVEEVKKKGIWGKIKNLFN